MSMSSSIIVSSCSIDLVQLILGQGELVLGKGTCCAMQVSHLWSLPSSLSILLRKLTSSTFSMGMGTGHNGGMFSLLDWLFLGSSKSLGLKTNPWEGGQATESDEILGVKDSRTHLESSVSVHSVQGLYFSVLFSLSSFRVCFPHLVSTCTINSTVSTSKSQEK